jgi:peptidase E
LDEALYGIKIVFVLKWGWCVYYDHWLYFFSCNQPLLVLNLGYWMSLRMTKFIFHGGGEGRGEDAHDGFFREIIDNLPNKAKVLCVYFAVPDEQVEEKHQVYVDFFSRNNADNKEIELKIASRDNFMEELDWADAVYFRGGGTEKLLEQIGKYSNFKEELLKKELVAGSSAGVYFLCNYGLSSRRDVTHKGLGILPIKAHCHYDGSKDLGEFSKLEGELLLLKEGEYKIINR